MYSVNTGTPDMSVYCGFSMVWHSGYVHLCTLQFSLVLINDCGNYICSPLFFEAAALLFLFVQIFFQFFCLVQSFPRQIQIVSSEVSVCGGLFVDRTAQIQHFDDSCRTEVEVFAYDFCQFVV